jgi:DNA-binding NarL/FixJ family response regulator
MNRAQPFACHEQPVAHEKNWNSFAAGQGDRIMPVDDHPALREGLAQLIGQGKGTRHIAEHLHLSVKTIESHRAHIKEKLNLKDANEQVHTASRMRGE